jgi:hypothetical protein
VNNPRLAVVLIGANDAKENLTLVEISDRYPRGPEKSTTSLKPVGYT